MNFGDVKNFILIGGGKTLLKLAVILQKNNFEVQVFSSPRHLNEYIDGVSLRDNLRSLNIPNFCTDDINLDERIYSYISPQTLGLALGSAWIFKKPLVNRLQGRFLNFYPVQLPRFKGGAHYTWQILLQNKIGACVLRLINEKLESGDIVKYKKYFFSPKARIPQDYYDEAFEQETLFFKEFIEDIKMKRTFKPFPLQDSFELYFPRLFTEKHGFIDWKWTTKEIELFICAFDNPYKGASTFVNGEKVFLKDCYSEKIDGSFHRFLAGIVYKKSINSLFVATKNGSIVIKQVLDKNGNNILKKIKKGYRFYTPKKYLEEAMLFNASYDAKGIKNK